MPIRTRSQSRQLKRKRVDIHGSADEQDEPPKKLQKVSTAHLEQKDEESDSDYVAEPEPELDPEPVVSTKSKPTKSKKRGSKKQKKSKNTAKGSSTTTKEDSDSLIDTLKSKHMELREEGFRCVVGVDEAGRGPLAGPVVVAAAFVPIEVRIDGITDSKKINEEEEREKLYEVIMATPSIKYSVAVLNHEMIDEYNILEASMMGMRECVQKLHDALVAEGEKGVDYALADGNRDPRFVHPQGLDYEYITKGDSKVYCIGAASIIAKVQRDRMMEAYDKMYPLYGFAGHKGYPTPQHKALVLSKGPCEIHRKSFRPVKDWYQRHKPEVHEKWETLKKQRAEERKSRLSKEKKAKTENKKETQKGGKGKKKGSKKGQKGKGKKGKNAKGKGTVKDEDKQPAITGFLSSSKTKGMDSVKEEQKELEEDDYEAEEEPDEDWVRPGQKVLKVKAEDQYLIDSEDDI